MASQEKDWVYGTYEGALLIVPRARAEECLRNLDILGLIDKSDDWDPVLSRYSRDEIEEAIGGLLEAAWWMQEVEPTTDRKWGELPEIKAIDSSTEAYASAIQILDDFNVLAALLPKEVIELVVWPDPPRVTENCEHCIWSMESLLEIRAVAARLGATLVEDQELLDKVETAYRSI